MFSVNCDGFGTGSNDKIDQAIKERKIRDTGGVMISSSYTIWVTFNK